MQPTAPPTQFVAVTAQFASEFSIVWLFVPIIPPTLLTPFTVAVTDRFDTTPLLIPTAPPTVEFMLVEVTEPWMLKSALLKLVKNWIFSSVVWFVHFV